MIKALAQIFLISGLLSGIMFFFKGHQEYLLSMFIYGLIGMILGIIYEAFIKTNTSS